MPLKRQADEKQRAWKKVFRQKYRERLRSAPGVPMHPKNDPKSDRVCCLQSSGLCHTMGRKHHRSNKKCWLFPQICEHCDTVRAGASEADKMDMLLSPAKLLSSDKDSVKDQRLLSGLHSTSNEASVQHNSIFHASANSSMIIDRTPRAVATKAANEAVRALGFEPHHREEILDSIEKDPSSSLPQTPPATPPSAYLGKQELLDLEQRLIRSQAPSPEACGMRAQWSIILRPELCTTRERCSSAGGESSTTALSFEVNDHGKPLKRDPRLDLNFVLAVA